jgi:hypothetical protein
MMTRYKTYSSDQIKSENSLSSRRTPSSAPTTANKTTYTNTRRNPNFRPANHSTSQRYPNRPLTNRTLGERNNFSTAALQVKSQSSFGKVKIMVMGGLEEVGRNMTLIEYEKEIINLEKKLDYYGIWGVGIKKAIEKASREGIKNSIKKSVEILTEHGREAELYKEKAPWIPNLVIFPGFKPVSYDDYREITLK